MNFTPISTLMGDRLRTSLFPLAKNRPKNPIIGQARKRLSVQTKDISLICSDKIGIKKSTVKTILKKHFKRNINAQLTSHRLLPYYGQTMSCSIRKLKFIKETKSNQSTFLLHLVLALKNDGDEIRANCVDRLLTKCRRIQYLDISGISRPLLKSLKKLRDLRVLTLSLPHDKIYKQTSFLKHLVSLKKLALKISLNKTEKITKRKYSERFLNFCFNLMRLKNL